MSTNDPQKEQFYFEDFFTVTDAEDTGDTISVVLRGREVPIVLKSGLSLGDRNAAKEKAVKKHVKPNGQIEITDIDEGLFQLELLSRTIKSWPFKYHDGRPVKVSKDTITAMFADNADELAKVVSSRLAKRDSDQKAFTKPSVQN